MEYKADERWTFEKTHTVGRTEPFPWVGMPTSAVLPHPGMSVWVFVALARLTGAQDPPALARAVAVTNTAAIALLLVFASLSVPAGELEAWLWAVALLALNPLTTISDRKIWPPTIVPLAAVALLCGFWHRRKPWGAFLWGAAGAAIGQLHTGALFFAAGFVVWVLALDRRSVRWGPWAIGSVLAGWPLVLWAQVVFAEARAGVSPALRLSRWLELKFWTRWATEPFGFGADYTLGRSFPEFLASPSVGGRPTFLMLAAHLALVGLALALLVPAVRRALAERPPLAGMLVGFGSPSAFVVGAALWGYGGLLTLTALPVHRHYLIVPHVLKFLWAAGLAFWGAGEAGRSRARALLLALGLVQGGVTAGLLHYIHVTRVIQGEYGSTYSSQVSSAHP